MEKVFQFITCILCACCYAACPVATRDGRYLGPAALAKLYRFVIDPRDKRPYESSKRVDNPTGVWGCDTVFRCNDVCPKDVRPADGIEGLRRTLVVGKIKRHLQAENMKLTYSLFTRRNFLNGLVRRRAGRPRRRPSSSPIVKFVFPPYTGARRGQAARSPIIKDMAPGEVKNFAWGNKPGLLKKAADGSLRRLRRRLHPPRLQRHLHARPEEILLRLPRGLVRREREQHRRPAAQAPAAARTSSSKAKT